MRHARFFLIILSFRGFALSATFPYYKARRIKHQIIKTAKEFNLDARILIAQAYAESSMNPKAINRFEKTGGPSRGLFQIQKGTARHHCKINVRQLMVPKWNIRCAAIIHRNYMTKYRSDEHAEVKTILSYNAGGYYICNKRHHKKGTMCELGWPVNIDYLHSINRHYKRLVPEFLRLDLFDLNLPCLLNLTKNYIDTY